MPQCNATTQLLERVRFNTKIDNTKCRQDAEPELASFASEGENGTATLEKSLVISYKVKHPAVLLLGINPNEMKTYQKPVYKCF